MESGAIKVDPKERLFVQLLLTKLSPASWFRPPASRSQPVGQQEEEATANKKQIANCGISKMVHLNWHQNSLIIISCLKSASQVVDKGTLHLPLALFLSLASTLVLCVRQLPIGHSVAIVPLGAAVHARAALFHIGHSLVKICVLSKDFGPNLRAWKVEQ